jgi:hypothetical protein
MRLIAPILCLLPLTAGAQDLFPLAMGPWTCLTTDGRPAFAFTIGDEGTYRDPEGTEGWFEQPGQGMIEMMDGPWAGTYGSHVPGGPMALVFPDSKVPVICIAPPAE